MNDTVFYQRPQSVTIPLHAYDIICNDLDLFNGDHLRLKLNTILNLIVLNLSGESQADFFNYGKNIHSEIENAISVCHKEILGEAKRLIPPASSGDRGKAAYKELGAFSSHSIRERIEYEYEKQFYAIQNKPVHGKTIRFTLTKKSVRKLYSIRGIPIEKLIGITDEQTNNIDNALCYHTVAKYLSRLFEAYAELNVRDRERIVFSDNSAFEPVIANLILTFHEPVNILRANTRNVGGVAKGEMVLQFMEYSQNTEAMKHYLEECGLAVEEAPEYAH